MNRVFWTSCVVTPLTGLLAAGTALAEPEAALLQTRGDSERSGDELSLVEPVLQGQVTSVSQLSDVRPTDWAFQALQSLVERYGCIVGYPDRTYRGNQPLSRYEFAAGLNACLDRINELIAASTADLVKKEDLDALRKLQEEFAVELATLRGRVDALEARTDRLERQQFSTTTKLNAEVVLTAAGVTTGENASGERIDRNWVLGNRVRINFDTSFTGEDLLRTRFQAINLQPFSETLTGTPEGDIRATGDDNNSVDIDALLYQFPIGKQTVITLEANAGASDDFADTFNPFIDGDGGTGAFTNFGTRNPIFYYIDGAGIGLRHQFGDAVEVSLGYLAGDPATPTADNGLFGGRYGAIAQVVIKPSEAFKFGFTYIHSYNNESGTGSRRSNPRSLTAGAFEEASEGEVTIEPGTAFAGGFTGTLGEAFTELGFDTTIPVVNNSFGFQASWQLSKGFVLNGWVGYTNTRLLSSGGGLYERGDLDIFNWAVTAAFPDFGSEGSLLGLVFGMEPRVTNSSAGLSATAASLGASLPSGIRDAFSEDEDTSLHIEAFYQYKLTDNIFITPGVIWLTAPDHNDRNGDIVIGVVRATFAF